MCKKTAAVSESLLKKLKIKAAQYKQPNPIFCLRLQGWCPCHLCSLPVMDKAKSLTLKCKKETSSCQTFKAKRLVEQGASLSSELGEAQGEVTAENRFLFEMQDKTLELFEQGKVPGNTVKNTEWAYRNFESW